MKTLHFIYLNNCFVSIHFVIRFMHAYRDFVADNNYAIFIQIPGLFKRQRLKNVILTLHLQLRTGNKKQSIVTKRFHLVTVRLSKYQRNQVFDVLKAGSTVNDIAHHFGCPRQTIHYLMILYNRTGYVRVRSRPGHARVTT